MDELAAEIEERTLALRFGRSLVLDTWHHGYAHQALCNRRGTEPWWA